MCTNVRSHLALPFALVGLVGGAIVGSLDGHSRVALIVALVTMSVAGVLGAIVAWHRAMPVGGVIVATLVAGGVNGFVLVFFADPDVLSFGPSGFAIAFVVGCVFAVPFVPALAHIAHLDAQIGSARHGSIVDRAQRRGPWAASFGWSGAAALLGAARSRPSMHSPFVVLGVLALVTSMALVLADFLALRRLRALDAAIDLGVGVDLTVDAPQRHYRDAPETILLARGDPDVAARVVREALARDLTACTVIGAAMMLFVFLRALVGG